MSGRIILVGKDATAGYDEAKVNSDGKLLVKDGDIATLLTTIDSVLDTIQTNVASVDNVVKVSNFARKTYDWSAAQTAVTIWTPASGKRIIICDITIGIATECTVKLFNDTDSTANRVAQFHFATNGGTIVNYKKPFALPTNGVLKITTSHASSTPAGSVTISGFEV